MARASQPQASTESLADATEVPSRERLVASALDAFAEFGFHGTTTREIAARTGMSPAALYVHHESKRAILFEIVQGAVEDVLGRVQTAAGGEGSVAERLGWVVEALVAYHALHSREARVANHELHWLDPDERAAIVSSRAQIEDTVSTLISEGKRLGEFDVVDGELAMTAIFSLCVDVARWWRPSRGTDAASLGRVYRELALRMLAARPAATGRARARRSAADAVLTEPE
jgi:AcrR family transcriptional regulator